MPAISRLATMGKRLQNWGTGVKGAADTKFAMAGFKGRWAGALRSGGNMVSQAAQTVGSGLKSGRWGYVGGHAARIGLGGFLGASMAGPDSRGLGFTGGVAAAYGGRAMLKNVSAQSMRTVGRGMTKSFGNMWDNPSARNIAPFAAAAGGVAAIGLGRATSANNPVNRQAMSMAPGRNMQGRFATLPSNNGF